MKIPPLNTHNFACDTPCWMTAADSHWHFILIETKSLFTRWVVAGAATRVYLQTTGIPGLGSEKYIKNEPYIGSAETISTPSLLSLAAFDWEPRLRFDVGVRHCNMAALSFPQFSSLPAELRALVWEFSLASIEPEVSIAWPLNLGGDRPYHPADASRDVMLPLTVDTAFSVLMHVCSESRRFAQDTKVSGLRYRTSAVARCEVPFRLFCPELDTLYFSYENLQGLTNLMNSGADIVPRIRNIAIEACDRSGLLAASNGMYKNCLALRTISGVFPQEPGPVVGEKPRTNPDIRRFPPPYRRCKLVRASDEIPEVLDRHEVGFLFSRPIWILMGLSMQRLGRFEDHEDGTISILPTQHAKVFIIRQQNGTWTKGYRDKSNYTGIPKPPEIPLEQRGDPEQVRVLETKGVWEIEESFHN